MGIRIITILVFAFLIGACSSEVRSTSNQMHDENLTEIKNNIQLKPNLIF